MLVFAHAAHWHGGSDVFPSLALGVQGLEAALAIAVSAGAAQTSYRSLVAHGAFHLTQD